MKSNIYFERIKNIPTIFKWKLNMNKYEFLIANEEKLINFDPSTVARLKRKHPLRSRREKELLKLHRKRNNSKKYGVLFSLEEKLHCNYLVCLAKKKGLLEKQPCEICGNKYNIQAHHEDYRKPFDIIWLCGGICHARRHIVINRMIRNGTYTQDSIASKLNKSYGKADE